MLEFCSDMKSILLSSESVLGLYEPLESLLKRQKVKKNERKVDMKWRKKEKTMCGWSVWSKEGLNGQRCIGKRKKTQKDSKKGQKGRNTCLQPRNGVCNGDIWVSCRERRVVWISLGRKEAKIVRNFCFFSLYPTGAGLCIMDAASVRQ